MIEITREQSAEVAGILMDAMRQMHEEMQNKKTQNAGECGGGRNP